MISVYCSEKLDGVAAAAIIMRHAVLAKLPAHFGGFLHPDALEDELSDIISFQHQLVFILDMGVPADLLHLLEKINKNNKLVYWCTHDSDSVVPPAKIFDRSTEKKCAAELAQQRFLPNDIIAKRLASLAHEVTFWQLRGDEAVKIQDLIAAQYDPIELIDSLSKGVFWNERFEKFHKEYSIKKQSALDELMKSLQVKAYVKFRFGFATASSLLTTADACQRILDGHAGVDVAVVLYRDGRIGFRRRDEIDVDCKKLAELFNGGGLPYASGAKLPMQVTRESLPDVLFHLDQAFRNFFVGVTV